MNAGEALARLRHEAQRSAAAEQVYRLRVAVDRLDASDPQRPALARMLADARAAQDRLAAFDPAVPPL